ncbi:13168_t:CDS:10 [Rhizophagus irregularis]|nr:13168_t:CDS:10 [Rhizophagus irregularis]
MSEGMLSSSDADNIIISTETFASSSKQQNNEISSKARWHLAISLDGSYILIFNNYELSKEKSFQVDKSYFLNTEMKILENQQYPLFQTALSRLVEYPNEKVIFIAISLVEKSDMLVDSKNQQHGKTLIYRMVKDDSGSFNSLEKYGEYQIGGIVRFIHSNESARIWCLIINSKGIFRYTYDSKYHSSKKNIPKHFLYPKLLEDELTNLYNINPCLERIEACLFDHYFVIEQYNEGIQAIQIFNLITMEMEQIFQERLYKYSYKKFSKPIFSISRNRLLIMFSTGIDSVLIFLIESGLEIACRKFGDDVKIMFGEFTKGDKELMLIIKEPKKKHATVVIWSLFSSAKNHIQYHEGDDNFITIEDHTAFKSYNSRCFGDLLTVDANGKVTSIFETWSSKEEEEDSQSKFYCKLIPEDKNSYMMPKKHAKNHPAHIIYRRKKDPSDEKPLVNNKEPWVIDHNYERVSAYLDEEETIQLIVGRTTVQIWQGNKDDVFLEYIWSNKTKLRDNDEEDTLNIEELDVGERTFYLKVSWTCKGIKENATIRWPYPDGHVTAIRHACEALAHLNYRKYRLVGHKKNHKFVKLINRISLVIWRFIKKNPVVWKLIDVRYDVMRNIIIGGSTFLVKYILFGEKDTHLHIPQIKRWEDDTIYVKEKIVEQNVESIQDEYDRQEINDKLTDLQVAICFCSKDRRIDRHVVIVGYLLEYYTNNAVQNIGWLITVSKAIPELYRHKLLVVKETHRRFDLKYLREKYIDIYTAIYQYIFPNPFRKIPPQIRIVPLYEFATSEIVEGQLEGQKDNPQSSFSKLFYLIFVPRGYLSQISEKLSPFVKIIRAEKDNNVFNNPTMEAAINYRWVPARNYFLRLYVLFILYATCYAVVCGFYLSHFSNGFADVVTTQEITVSISFTVLILWFEFILYLRLLSETARYIFIILNILEKSYIFLLFMFLVLAAFAHSMFILLQHPTFTNVTQKSDTYSLKYSTTNKPIDVTVTKDFDPNSRLDNPNTNFLDSLISSYFWLSGSYVQNDTWDFWAVETLTLLASIFVVTVLQNMFIAFMGGIYSEADTQANNALLRFRADSVSDYEALDDIHFLPLEPDPKYIFYLGTPSCLNTWKEISDKKKDIKLYSKYEEEIAEIKDLFVEKNLDVENTLWDWDDNNKS